MLVFMFFSISGTAEANYWSIDYAPSEVGVLKGSDVNPGDADDIAYVLSAMGCKYITVEPSDLADIASGDSDMKILFVEGSPSFFNGTQPGDSEKIINLALFVGRGGHLFVTGKADLLINSLGLSSGISMYKPLLPGEELIGTGTAVPMDPRGNLRAYLQTSSITVSFPVGRRLHSILDLASVAAPGSEPELTALYGYRYIAYVGGYVDWVTDSTYFLTSLVFPYGNNNGTVHYVNYNLDHAYNHSGKVGKDLVEYQFVKILGRAGIALEDVIDSDASYQVSEMGEIENESKSLYAYKPGRGTISFSLGEPGASLKMRNLRTINDLSISKIDDDLFLSVKGFTGEVRMPGWFSGGGKLRAVETAGGEEITASYLEANAQEREPDIDITPVSFDRRVVPEIEQIDVFGDERNDYLFGNAMDNTLYGEGGSNIYYYRLGEGSDTIINAKEGDNMNVLRFHMDITSRDIVVSRSGDDLRFALPGGGVTVKDWYGRDSARLDRVEIYDGTYWDIRDLEKLADGKALPPRGSGMNPAVRAANAGSGEKDQGSGCQTVSGCWILFLVPALFYKRQGKRL
jgi:hypothetical protein